ncbi:putative gustatory receptor 28b [Bradysia coprophila]|uniref:putative gustatory receptor 28b n=1 Tax=Bradysia coprophila TaxID=38358 RepID=UPI00187D8261|nr:putative gustatory receptor 28b [Bradysia coprophila]
MAGVFNRLKNYLKPTDIYTSQRLILCLVNFAGYLPLQITKNRNGRHLRSSAIGFTFSIIFFTITVACFVALFMNGRLWTLGQLFDRQALANYGAFIRIVSICIMVPVLYGSCIRTGKKMITCMRLIVNIDKRLNLLGIDIDYWKGFYFSVYVIGSISTYFIVSLSMAYWLNDILSQKATKILQQDPGKKEEIRDPELALWLLFMTHNVTMVSMTLFICYYASITKEIGERFESMNRMLKFMVEPDSELTAHRDIESIESASWNIRNNVQMYNLLNIHSDLCDICVSVSDYFSLKMVSVLAVGLTTVVLNGYFFAMASNGIEQKEKFVELIYTTIDSFCVSLAIIIACNSAQHIVDENEKCSFHVRKALNLALAPDAKDKLLIFSLQLLSRKIKFSALGLFDINCGLLMAMAESVTTYFLIMMDFHGNQQN